MVKSKFNSPNINQTTKKEWRMIIMTVKEKVKAYRQTKKALARVTIPRLTAVAYVGNLQLNEKKCIERKQYTEKITDNFKSLHFPDMPITLKEAVKLKPEKITPEAMNAKIKAISDSIDKLSHEYKTTSDKKQKQAIEQKIYHLKSKRAELLFNKHDHKEYEKIDYTWDMLKNDVLTDDGENITNLSKIITFCSCKKSIEREGTKTQYSMFYSCCSADWYQHDVYDALSVARLSMIECLTADIRQINKYIYFLEKSVDMLKHLNSVVDVDEIEKIVHCFKKHCPYITDDYRTNRRLANRYKWIVKSLTDKSIDDLVHSVFLGINNYLVSIRAIHTSNNFAVNSLEADYEYYCNIPENETKIDLLFNDSDKKEKRQAILSAYHKISDIITKSELTTFKYLIKGYTVSQIAYKRKITKQCVNNHLCNIRSAFSRFIASNPLEYAVIADCIVIGSDSPKTDSEKTTEKKTDRQIETDRIKTSMTDGLKDGIKADIIDSLNDLERMIYHSLVNNLTVRQTAETISKSPKYVQTRKAKIQEKIFTVIENECSISINRDLFTNISLYDLVSIFD